MAVMKKAQHVMRLGDPKRPASIIAPPGDAMTEPKERHRPGQPAFPRKGENEKGRTIPPGPFLHL
ncbi:hypothetical protein [Rhizobium rhizosphaerae]|uniref:hypothetical protein n=1 Tax=Xaviernesmea rhizosphaerae TaxID=1672749 RepID=UPI00117A65E6|nr:hypothetical protein [Xaviernesmea rhizosphaerae]